MRRSLLVRPPLLAGVLTGLLAGGPASAIIGDSFDGDRHPAVGGPVAPEEYADGTWLSCSDLLVAITIDAVCRATNVVHRLDTASARSVLAPYVAVP